MAAVRLCTSLPSVLLVTYMYAWVGPRFHNKGCCKKKRTNLTLLCCLDSCYRRQTRNLMVLQTGPSYFCITLFHLFSLAAQYGHSGRGRQNKGKVQGYNISHTFSDHSQLLPKDVSFYDLAARTKLTLKSTRYQEFTVAIGLVFIRSSYFQREAGNVCNCKFP